MATAPRVVAVVVAYLPDAQSLQATLRLLAPQVLQTVVVDNSPPGRQPALPGVHVVRLNGNHGVGAAQNAGIREAAQAGADFVLLMDQDSLPAPDMVAQQLHAYAQAGARVGAVGARVRGGAGYEDGFVRFRRGRYEAAPVPADVADVDCDMLIASGTLIPMPVLHDVGGMAEDLFIDKIDTEWCLRARAHGWRLVGAPHAVLQHRLGEQSVRLWFGGWRRLRLHQPFRYYYMVRNGLLLRRSPHRTAAWCRADRRQLLSLLLYFGLMKPQGFVPLRMMLRGLVDGLRGVSGALR